jgi:hypothetical protein
MTHNPNGNESGYKYCITKYLRRNLAAALWFHIYALVYKYLKRRGKMLIYYYNSSWWDQKECPTV